MTLFILNNIVLYSTVHCMTLFILNNIVLYSTERLLAWPSTNNARIFGGLKLKQFFFLISFFYLIKI